MSDRASDMFHLKLFVAEILSHCTRLTLEQAFIQNIPNPKATAPKSAC